MISVSGTAQLSPWKSGRWQVSERTEAHGCHPLVRTSAARKIMLRPIRESTCIQKELPADRESTSELRTSRPRKGSLCTERREGPNRARSGSVRRQGCGEGNRCGRLSAVLTGGHFRPLLPGARRECGQDQRQSGIRKDRGPGSIVRKCHSCVRTSASHLSGREPVKRLPAGGSREIHGRFACLVDWAFQQKRWLPVDTGRCV